MKFAFVFNDRRKELLLACEVLCVQASLGRVVGDVLLHLGFAIGKPVA